MHKQSSDKLETIINTEARMLLVELIATLDELSNHYCRTKEEGRAQGAFKASCVVQSLINQLDANTAAASLNFEDALQEGIH